VPLGARGKNTTLIAAMTLRGAMGACMAVGKVRDPKALVFEAYVERFLRPSLRPGVRCGGDGQ